MRESWSHWRLRLLAAETRQHIDAARRGVITTFPGRQRGGSRHRESSSTMTGWCWRAEIAAHACRGRKSIHDRAPVHSAVTAQSPETSTSGMSIDRLLRPPHPPSNCGSSVRLCIEQAAGGVAGCRPKRGQI